MRSLSKEANYFRHHLTHVKWRRYFVIKIEYHRPNWIPTVSEVFIASNVKWTLYIQATYIDTNLLSVLYALDL